MSDPSSTFNSETGPISGRSVTPQGSGETVADVVASMVALKRKWEVARSLIELIEGVKLYRALWLSGAIQPEVHSIQHDVFAWLDRAEGNLITLEQEWAHMHRGAGALAEIAASKRREVGHIVAALQGLLKVRTLHGVKTAISDLLGDIR